MEPPKDKSNYARNAHIYIFSHLSSLVGLKNIVDTILHNSRFVLYCLNALVILSRVRNFLADPFL
jgi:hypothetical protein